MPSRKSGRERLVRLLRSTRGVITVDDAVASLELDRSRAAKLLARWAEQGWLKRIRRGLYSRLPVDADPNATTIENPWLLVPTLFTPGYVGGWSAAEHWDLTEQIFRDVCVFTAKSIRDRRQTIEETTFVVHKIAESQIFGMKTVWESGTRLLASDIHKTIVDMLAWPETGGGMRHVADCLRAYLSAKNADPAKLISYAEQIGSGAVFKRLGFLLEVENENPLASECQTRMSNGYAKLDPALPKDRLVTRWRLWIPSTWNNAT